EDGIRDGHVTGVQTCALPILVREYTFLLDPAELRQTQSAQVAAASTAAQAARHDTAAPDTRPAPAAQSARPPAPAKTETATPARSEERRVGKGHRSRICLERQ